MSLRVCVKKVAELLRKNRKIEIMIISKAFFLAFCHNYYIIS